MKVTNIYTQHGAPGEYVSSTSEMVNFRAVDIIEHTNGKFTVSAQVGYIDTTDPCEPFRRVSCDTWCSVEDSPNIRPEDYLIFDSFQAAKKAAMRAINSAE